MAVGTADQIVAYNVHHYYPGQIDTAGFFYYANVVGGWSSAEGKWFASAEDSDRALREFLVSLGAPRALGADIPGQSSRPER